MNARTVLRDAARTLSATGVYVIALQLVGVLVVRLLGVGGRGEVAAAILVPTIIATVGSLGVPVATAYLLNAHPTDRQFVIGTARSLTLMLSLIMGSISLILCWVFPVHETVRAGAVLFSFYVPFTLMASVHQAVLQADLRMGAFNAARLSGVLVYLALVVALALLDVASVTAVVLCQFAGVAVWWALSVVLVNDQPWFAFDRVIARSLLRFGTRGHLGSMGTVDNLRLDQLVLALFLSTYDLGLYVVAMTFLLANRMIGTSVGMVAFPVAARSANARQRRRLLAGLVVLVLGLSLVAALAETVYGRDLLRIFFDVEDSKAHEVLVLAAAASVFLNLRQVSNDILRGIGKPGIPTVGELVALVTLGLSAVLLWNRGVVGVAVAVLIAYVLSFVVVISVSFVGIALTSFSVPSVRSGISSLTASTATRPLYTIVSILLTSCAVGWFLTFRQYTISDVYILLVGVLLIVILIPLVRRIAQHRFDPFEPIVIFFVAFGAMFVVRPLAVISSDDFLYVHPTRSIDIQSSFIPMLVIGLIGGASFVIGYELRIGKRLAKTAPNPPTTFHADTVITGSFVLSALGLGLFAIFIMQSGGIPALLSFVRGRDIISQVQLTRQSTGYLYLGHYLLIPAALILFAIGRLHHNLALVFSSVVLTVTLLIRAAPSGSRMTLLPFVGGFFVYWYVSRGRRPTGIGTIAIVFVALIGSTLLREGRVVTSGESRQVGTIFMETLTHPQRAFEPLTEGADNEMVEALAAVLGFIPDEFNYQFGRATFGDFLIRPVPRTVWPDKPQIPRVEVLSTLYPHEYKLGIANQEFTSLFFFYLDFGYFGVFAWMIAYGIMSRAFYEYFLIHRDSMPVQIVFSLGLFFLVIALRDSPVDTFARFCFIVVPAILMFSVAKARQPGHVDLTQRFVNRPSRSEIGVRQVAMLSTRNEG